MNTNNAMPRGQIAWISWGIQTAGLVLPSFMWGLLGAPWDVFVLPLALFGFVIAGFVMGWKTVRKNRDLLFALMPLCGFPFSLFLLGQINLPAGISGHAGMSILFGAIYFFPIVLAPVYLLSVLAGRALRDREEERRP